MLVIKSDLAAGGTFESVAEAFIADHSADIERLLQLPPNRQQIVDDIARQKKEFMENSRSGFVAARAAHEAKLQAQHKAEEAERREEERRQKLLDAIEANDCSHPSVYLYAYLWRCAQVQRALHLSHSELMAMPAQVVDDLLTVHEAILESASVQ